MFLRASVAIMLLCACSPTRYAPGTHYFAWAGLYTDPPRPTRPITRERAQSSGYAFYIGEYGANGELVQLRKTYRG